MLENRPLFHIHVPKTAGLSLRMIFAELCGLDRVFKLGVAGGGVVNTIEDFMARDWPGDLPGGRAPLVYLGHFPYGPQQKVSPAPFVTTCLRHPVERVLSHYEYRRRTGAPDLGIEDFIADDPENENGMVRRLCGFDRLDGVYWDFVAGAAAGRDERSLDGGDLARARQNLFERIDFFLIQERMAESLVALRGLLAAPPLISVHNQFRNSSHKPIRQADYPARVVGAIAARNRLDLALYDEALVRFDARLKELAPDPEEIAAMQMLGVALSMRGQQDLPQTLVEQRLQVLLGGLVERGEQRLAERAMGLWQERMRHGASDGAAGNAIA